MKQHFPGTMRFSFFLLSIILLFYVLIQAKLFLYPIALGVLFAYLLFPIANFLEMHRVPRIAAILISILLGITVVFGGMMFVYNQIGVFVDDFPSIRTKALKNIDLMESFLEDTFQISDIQLVHFLRDRVVGLFEAGSNFYNRLFSSTAGTLFRIFIMPVYVFLFLYYRTKFAYFILKLVSDEKRFTTLKILREVARLVSRYMGGVTTVVLILCVLNSSGLLILGVRYAMILGVLSALFNYIPYFGTWIGASIPIAYALLAGDSFALGLKVIVLYAIIQFTENNILTPNIVGANVKLSPFIIIIGLIAAGMVWGIPGMFVVVPALAVFHVICEHVESLRPYGYLLGTYGTRKHAITVENIRKLARKIRDFKGPAS